jgi:hypothetical protein
MKMAAMKLGNTPRLEAWSPPLASFPPPALILVTSSSNYLPHLAAAAFKWMGVGRMIACGNRWRRELLINRGATRSKGGPNRHKNPWADPTRSAVPGPFWVGSGPSFSHHSSSHFALGPLHLRHFEVVIPAINIGGLLV